MRGKPRTISVMRELAECQHGVFARRQLLARGVGPKVIERCLLDRRIEAVYRGVYAFSRELLGREGRWMAAVLAAGPGAVLSHASAAALWGVLRPAAGPIHVTCPRKLRSRPSLFPHCLPFSPDEITVHEDIPITTPSRTLFDIAHDVRPHQLSRAMREMDYRRLPVAPPCMSSSSGIRGGPE